MKMDNKKKKPEISSYEAAREIVYQATVDAKAHEIFNKIIDECAGNMGLLLENEKRKCAATLTALELIADRDGRRSYMELVQIARTVLEELKLKGQV